MIVIVWSVRGSRVGGIPLNDLFVFEAMAVLPELQENLELGIEAQIAKLAIRPGLVPEYVGELTLAMNATLATHVQGDVEPITELEIQLVHEGLLSTWHQQSESVYSRFD
jgi:hypothetical protein